MYFSVLVPVYNVEDDLEACIRSVLQQTEADFELILVDDGSTDGSSAICDRFFACDPGRVKVIHKENGGVVSARNEAIGQAAGDAVVFLDGDDCLRRDALEQIRRAFETHGCDMVLYNYAKSADFSDKCAQTPFTGGLVDKKQLYTLLCGVSDLNSLSVKAVKTPIARLLPEQVQWEAVTNGEDLLCSLPMVTAAEKIAYVDEALYFYRTRPGSAVHRFSERKLRSLKTVHGEFARYLDLWQMPQLHPKHCARQVRGWVNALRFLPAEEKGERRRLLRNMETDPYFLRAYEQMDAGMLSVADRLLARWLYKKNHLFLSAAAAAQNMKAWMKK